MGLKGIRERSKLAKTPKSTMQVDQDVADLVRRLAGYEGRRLSELLNDMLIVYLRERWPNLELVFDDEAEPQPEPEGILKGSTTSPNKPAGRRKGKGGKSSKR